MRKETPIQPTPPRSGCTTGSCTSPTSRVAARDIVTPQVSMEILAIDRPGNLIGAVQ